MSTPQLAVGKSARRHGVGEFLETIKDYIRDELQQEPITEYRLGRDRWSSKADVGVELGKNKLFIEVEERQPHPDTNVTKYWHWIEREKISEKIVLIQIFGSDFYDNNYRARTELCTFVANKMRGGGVDFVYIPIPREKQHRYKSEWRLSALLTETKRAIREVAGFLTHHSSLITHH